MIVVLLGPPGSGKGTQAKVLWKERLWPQLSTGDMLRSAIDRGSQLGQEAKVFINQGKLVPDSVVVGLIEERISNSDCKDGFILDGFPRNIAQAEVLDKILGKKLRKVDRVILFEMPEDELIRRISGRRTCVSCGSMFHVDHAPPKAQGICDQCGHALIQRPDDMPAVIKERLAVYHQQTEPLIEYYRNKKLLKTLDARQSPSQVGQVLSQALT